MFFDTNIIILLFNLGLDERSIDILNDKIANKDAYISNIVLGEVLGYYEYTEQQAASAYKEMLRDFKIVSVDTDIMLLAAQISRYQRRNTGKKLKLTDAIIAATAILQGKPLLTFDKEDFKNISNLELF